SDNGGLYVASLLFGIARWFVQDRNFCKRNRCWYGLQVGKYIGEFLVGHYLASIRRHVAGARIAHIRGETCDSEFRLSEARSCKATLSDSAVALIAAVAHEDAFAVGGIAGLRLSDSECGKK